MYLLTAASLILVTALHAETASFWRQLSTDHDRPPRSGPGYSITLRAIHRAESHQGDRADHMLWVRKGSAAVNASSRVDAGPGDLVRIPRGTPWSIEPAGGRVELIDVRIEPLGEGRQVPGIRPAPGKMGLRVTKAEIDAAIARTEANAPLHAEDNFTANLVLFKGRVGPRESHAGCTDIYLVQTGEGLIQTGGKIVNARDVSLGEPRGTVITGSRDFAIGAGDLLVIPRNVAHHMNPKRLPLAYVLINVWPE